MLDHNPDLPAVVEGGRAITVSNAQPLSIEAYRERRVLMKEAVTDMEENVDYGRIPGTKDLSLWEPGAEALRFAFNIQFKNECLEEIEDYKTHYYRYRYKCIQLLGPGIEGPSWEASGNSRERKFWCKGAKWVNKKKVEDGCPTPCDGEHPPFGMEAAMLPHNVRDRVQKRAFVAMIRNVTGATGLFKGAGVDRYDAQDEMPEDDDTFAGGGSNDHPWLVTCPVHNVKWFKSGNMREPSHKVGDEWCNQSRALKPLLDKEAAKLTQYWEKKDVQPWLKENFSGTWSQLSAKQQLDAIEKLKTTVPPGSEPEPTATVEASAATPEPAQAPAQQPVMATDPATAPANVDGQTGQIDAPQETDPPPTNEGPPPEKGGGQPENQTAMEGMGPGNQEH